MKDSSQLFKMPHVEAGMKVGLYGGSFNPPHQGHKLLAEMALKRFQLDQIWWMVTPGNPLKDKRELLPLERRIAQSRALIHHPKIHVTGFEAGLRTSYSATTIALIRQARPRVHFIWLMGADNLGQFHIWQQWREIAASVGMGIIDRYGATLNALSSPAARCLARFRLPERQASSLALIQPPVWCFLHTPRLNVSSTSLRLKIM